MSDGTVTAPAVVAVAGEALVDLLPAGAGLLRVCPGGSPANVAVGLARLDVPVRMVARLAEDVFGQALREHLTRNGVDLSRAVLATEPTSLAIVHVGPDGRVAYDFRVQGTADWQWTDFELVGVLDDDVVAVHAGSVAMVTPPGAVPLRRMLARARSWATVSYDPNCRPALMDEPAAVLHQVHRILAYADVVKVSAEDLAWLVPGRSPAQVITDWLNRGPSLVAVTLGADGALAATAACARPVARPGVPVDVADTVGAGDAFTAALLAGLHRRDLLGARNREAIGRLSALEIADLLDEAVLVAAVTCSRVGADPPTATELGTAALVQLVQSG